MLKGQRNHQKEKRITAQLIQQSHRQLSKKQVLTIATGRLMNLNERRIQHQEFPNVNASQLHNRSREQRLGCSVSNKSSVLLKKYSNLLIRRYTHNCIHNFFIKKKRRRYTQSSKILKSFNTTEIFKQENLETSILTSSCPLFVTNSTTACMAPLS